MRHRKSGVLLNRFTGWRKATLTSLMRNILIYQSIKTSLQKAKAVRPDVDKLISLAKSNTLADKRKAFSMLNDHKLVSTLFSDIGPRFTKKQGGYTRIINLGNRRGDNAQMVIFELTEIKIKEAKKHIKKEKQAKPAEAVEPEGIKEPSVQEHKVIKTETEAAGKEKAPVEKKPTKKFLGGFKNIFKKERDSL